MSDEDGHAEAGLALGEQLVDALPGDQCSLFGHEWRLSWPVISGASPSEVCARCGKTRAL